MSFFVTGAVHGEVLVLLFVAGAVLGEVLVLLLAASAVLGEVLVSLFVAGAVLGEVLVLLLVAGAVLGEGQLSLFVAGAAHGECKIGRETLYFTKENAPGELEKQPHLRGGLRFAFLCSDHARIVLGSWSDQPRIGNDVSAVFRKFLPDVGWSFCVAGAICGEFGR